MFKKFVSANRRASHWLIRKWPRIFDARYNKPDLSDCISETIAKIAPRTILEVGGIDRPLLKKDSAYRYIGMDIEAKPACNEIYDTFTLQSIEQPVDQKFDLVISRTLLEHVPNNQAAIRNISDALNPNGMTLHFIPSRWHPYSMILRCVGPRAQRFLIRHLRPAAIGVSGYPAFFDYCDPKAMKALFLASGLRDVSVFCYYRAGDYFAFFLPAYILVALYENLVRLLGLKTLCYGFIIIATKPAGP